MQLIGRCQFTFDEQTLVRASEPFLQNWSRFLPDTTALTQQLALMQFLDLFGLRRDRRIAAIEAAVCRNLGDFRPKGSGNYWVF